MSDTRPECEVVTHQARLDELAPEWDRLYARCPTVTPFQTHAWTAAWARAYCPPGRLRVVVVRDGDGELAAAAPLQLVRRGAWPVLVPLGGEITDFTDLLVPDPCAAAAAALTRAVVGLPGWRLLDLPQLRPDAGALAWARTWPGQVTRLPGAVSLELPVQPLAELVARAPKRTAGVIRRKLRRIDEAGVTASTVPAAAVPGAVADMLRLHREQWRGRGITPEHLTARFADHLTEAFSRMVPSDQAMVVAYHLDGEPVAVQLELLGHRFLGYYLAGISPRLRERIDTATLLVRNDVGLALKAGLPRYSMMRGEEDYKLRWRPDRVQNTRLLLSRPGRLGGAGLPALTAARAAAVAWGKRTEWVREVYTRGRRAAVRPGRAR